MILFRAAFGPLAAAWMAIALPGAHAQTPPELALAGRAQTGADIRDVRFIFMCTANNGPGTTGTLSVALAVPGYEALEPDFSFDDFEGPSADAGKLTTLEATGAGARARETYQVGGWIGVEPDPTFHLSVSAALRNDAADLASVARVLRIVSAGPARLVWRQGNPKPGGAQIVATLLLKTADAARLQALIAPCLAAAAHPPG